MYIIPFFLLFVHKLFFFSSFLKTTTKKSGKASGFLSIHIFGQFFSRCKYKQIRRYILPLQPRKKQSVVVYSIILVINKNGVGLNTGRKSLQPRRKIFFKGFFFPWLFSAIFPFKRSSFISFCNSIDLSKC